MIQSPYKRGRLIHGNFGGICLNATEPKHFGGWKVKSELVGERKGQLAQLRGENNYNCLKISEVLEEFSVLRQKRAEISYLDGTVQEAIVLSWHI